MGDLIKMPEDASWNATTGTFDQLGTKAAEINPQQVAELIADRLGASELAPDQKAKVLTALDSGAVYLHQPDPTNRRSQPVNSIAKEWASLGITLKQAEVTIDRSIDYARRQGQMDFEQEPKLARDAGGDLGL
jgi:hypothetical protein